MVPNIFGTEDKDGDNICEILNNYLVNIAIICYLVNIAIICQLL